METQMVLDGRNHTLTTEDGRLTITLHEGPMHFGEDYQVFPPNAWVVTRDNGVPLFAVRPKKGERSCAIIKATALYREKIQWFEPLADNYRELVWVNPDCSVSGSEAARAFKHVSWSDIANFSVVDRMSISFSSGMAGDWKASAQGGDGYLMAFVEGLPFWSDALGQIPFAVDTFRMYLERLGDLEAAIVETVKTGIEYGDGNPLLPGADPTNEYDNYMVLRGALWASENFKLSEHTQRVEGNIMSRTVTTKSTVFVASSTLRLRSSVDKAAIARFGAWRR